MQTSVAINLYSPSGCFLTVLLATTLVLMLF